MCDEILIDGIWEGKYIKKEQKDKAVIKNFVSIFIKMKGKSRESILKDLSTCHYTLNKMEDRIEKEKL